MPPTGAPAKTDNTEQGPHWWFTGYATGDLFGAKPTLIKNRWIYILERRAGVPVKLHLEISADRNGMLSQVSGDPRRHKERTANLPSKDVATVSVPTVIQGDPASYFFFASPTRLTKRAVWELTAMARPSSDWLDLKRLPGGRAYFHDDRPPVLLVVDPLTTAVALHSAYVEALDNRLHYVMPSERATPGQAEAIHARVIKYQLANLIVRNLLPDRTDPFNVRKELADATGDQVFHYVEQFDAQIAARDAQVDQTAALLIQHFQSPHWDLLARLHLFNPEDTSAWLEFVGPCIERLNSCPRGVAYLGGVFDRPPPWFEPAGLIAPGGEKMPAETAILVARKAAAGVLTVWAEIFPAAVVLKKLSAQQALERIERIYRVMVRRTSVKIVAFTPGRMVSISRIQTSVQARLLDPRALQDDLKGIEDWTKEREARWPEESAGAHAARAVTNVLRAFELLNLGLKLDALFDANNENQFEASCDVAGAVLDTGVAFEDSLKKVLGDSRLVGAAFKMMGAVSSLIDVFLTASRIADARRDNKGDLIPGYRAAFVPGVLGVVGGLLHTGVAISGTEGSLVISAGLAASALCFAAFAGAIVIGLYQEGKKRGPFQRFVNHTVFGLKTDPREGAEWVSGETFAKWNNTSTGLRLQAQTLSLLFANFQIVGQDPSTIDVRLGSMPPGTRLEITFIHGDHENDWMPSHRPTLRATALIDPYARGGEKAIVQSTGAVDWQVKISRSATRPTAVRIGARPKARWDTTPLTSCLCELRLLLTPERADDEKSEAFTIPPRKDPLRYLLVEGAGVVNHQPKTSLPDPD